jgi:hypothetical protein
LKNQNSIKVSPANDLENVEMDLGSDNFDGEIEVINEESKEDKRNVRNIFGSIVDFITNKNSIEDDKSFNADKDRKSKTFSKMDTLKPKDVSEFTSKSSQRNNDDIKSKTRAVTEVKEVDEDDFKSKIIGLFTGNNSKSKQRSSDTDTPKDKDSDRELPSPKDLSKDEKLYEIDEKSRKECIQMLKYYRPTSKNKTLQKVEKFLPIFIELECPIPEELSLDYEFAKYDISGLVPQSESNSIEYKDTLVKYETLA